MKTEQITPASRGDGEREREEEEKGEEGREAGASVLLVWFECVSVCLYCAVAYSIRPADNTRLCLTVTFCMQNNTQIRALIQFIMFITTDCSAHTHTHPASYYCLAAGEDALCFTVFSQGHSSTWDVQ